MTNTMYQSEQSDMVGDLTPKNVTGGVPHHTKGQILDDSKLTRITENVSACDKLPLI